MVVFDMTACINVPEGHVAFIFGVKECSYFLMNVYLISFLHALLGVFELSYTFEGVCYDFVKKSDDQTVMFTFLPVY
jgi:hypothetical protein